MTSANSSSASDPAHSYTGPVIVAGASSGGTEALQQFISGLPADFPGCVLVVRHLSPEASASYLVRHFKAHTPLPCQEARDGMLMAASHIYVAAANHHLLVDDRKIWVVHGPRENRWRPAVDALFRSAAVSHGNRVIGIVLSGSLDDGTAGLAAIKRCGGRCIVQDPDEAAFPDMPRNAMNNVAVDHCVPLARIAPLVVEMLGEKNGSAPAVPPDIQAEARILLSARSGIETVEQLGDRTVMTCPDCGGVLWELNTDGFVRFRCHTGHAFSVEQLLEGQTARIEETLWRALRMFEERRNLLTRMGHRVPLTKSAAERITEAEDDIERLRVILSH